MADVNPMGAVPGADAAYRSGATGWVGADHESHDSRVIAMDRLP